jgi:hypothetical protein
VKGIQYLTDDKGSKTALLINLKRHDKRLNAIIEDVEDVLECEKLKDEPTVPFDKVVKNLYSKGKISKKVYDKIYKK